MQMSQPLKQKHTARTVIVSITGIMVLAIAAVYISQVFSIRSQILAGEYDFETFGAETSGAGGANIDTEHAYPVATDDDPSIGPQDAVVTIVEFGDFECPYCGSAFPIIRSVIARYPDQVRYIYRDFPLDDIHPSARAAAQAGYCAQQEGKFWQLHDRMFQNQAALSRASILSYAQQSGLRPETFLPCFESDAARAEVEGDVTDGIASGVLGTPTWFINGIRVAGVIPEDILVKIIEDFLPGS